MEDIEQMTKKHREEIKEKLIQDVEVMTKEDREELKKQLVYVCPNRQSLKTRKVANKKLKEALQTAAIVVAAGASLIGLGVVKYSHSVKARDYNANNGMEIYGEMMEYYKDNVSPGRYSPNEFFAWRNSEAGQEKQAELEAEYEEEQKIGGRSNA